MKIYMKILRQAETSNVDAAKGILEESDWASNQSSYPLASRRRGRF